MCEFSAYVAFNKAQTDKQIIKHEKENKNLGVQLRGSAWGFSVFWEKKFSQ